MTNNKKGSLLKLGLLAAGAGLVINELSKGSTNRSANVTGAIAGAIDTTDAAELIRTIEGSKVLQDYFKRLTAQPTAPTVQDIVTNINNSYTLDGVQYQSFGDSLLQNGTGELGSLDSWISKGSATNDQLSVSWSSTAIIGIIPSAINRLISFNLNLISKSGSAIYIISEPKLLNGTLGAWQYTAFTTLGLNTKYLGFVGAKEFKIILNSPDGVSNYSELMINIVPLGEAVPSNLAWLPVGQEVYDSTTGDRGRYNGTTIDWYTMV